MLRRQNNPEVNYSTNLISGVECFQWSIAQEAKRDENRDLKC